MRFIHKWSYALAKLLAIKVNESHEKRRVFYFGFLIIIGALVKGVLLVGISLLFGSLLPSLVAVLVFATFRMIGGGYHMDTYGKCIAVSLGLFILAGTITQYTYSYWNFISVLTLLLVTIMIASYVTLKWVPKDTPNKRITEEEAIRKFKRLGIYYILCWSLLCFGMMIFKLPRYELYIIAGSFGFLLELFSISPIGYSFFDWVNGKVDIKVKKTTHR